MVVDIVFVVAIIFDVEEEAVVEAAVDVVVEAFGMVVGKVNDEVFVQVFVIGAHRVLDM